MAVDMQGSLKVREPVHKLRPKARIGVHGERVLIENGDLHGEVVNTAARVVALAKRDQITGVTTVLPNPLMMGEMTLDICIGGETRSFAASHSTPITVGRGENNTICVDDSAASRAHASVSDPDGSILEDGVRGR